VSLLLPAFLNWDHTDPKTTLQVFSVCAALLVIGVTGVGSWWIANKVEHQAVLHGLLVGVVVAILSFLLDLVFSREVRLMGLLLYILMVAAGFLGGVLGSRRLNQA
jgi:putative membrane protein (TIGR04086 family)